MKFYNFILRKWKGKKGLRDTVRTKDAERERGMIHVGTRFLLTRSWIIRPWPKKSHTTKFVEYGLKNSVSVGSDGSLHVLSGCRNVNQENRCERWKFHSWTCFHTKTSCFFFSSPLPSFSVPPFWGTLTCDIGPLLSSGPYTCWSSKSLLEHLSHQTPLPVLCELQWPR